MSFLSYTIYFNPSDFPGKYVVRGWDMRNSKSMPRASATVHETLTGARAVASVNGRACFQRQPDDDKCILETWL